jgi:hypothetical protein
MCGEFLGFRRRRRGGWGGVEVAFFTCFTSISYLSEGGLRRTYSKIDLDS